MTTIPDAVAQNPACGACRTDTYFNGDEYVCDDCGLMFDADDLSASFLDPQAQPCSAPCDNWWHHADNRIYDGKGFDCSTCQLPAGHPSKFHWTGCQVRPTSAAHLEG